VSQRILQLLVSEPLPWLQDLSRLSDLSPTVKFATLEFDLAKDTVRLPAGGFVCRLASLVRVVNTALAAQERWKRDRALYRKGLREFREGYYK